MGVRRPKYEAGTATAIDTSEATLAYYDVRGYGPVSLEIVDAGSGGNLTVKVYAELDPSATQPTVKGTLPLALIQGATTGLGTSEVVTDGATEIINVEGCAAFLVVTGAHASSEVNATCNMLANPETGGGEW